MNNAHTFAYPPTFKRTKIIATIGPATNSYQAIYDLIRAGANGLRLNFSHGTYEERDQQINWIRQASRELDKPVAVYQDLQGPKIRLGEVEGNHLTVKAGQSLELVYGLELSHDSVIPIQYDISTRVKPGQRVYIFDGKVRTTVTAAGKGSVTVKVENDGVLMSRKGVNLPDTDFSGDVLTEKDYRDIDYGAKHDVDYVGLSFVHSAEDIKILRSYLAAKGSEAKIIAKIETQSAIDQTKLAEIVEVSDAVMVARGDLATEVGNEIVPVVQREILKLCQQQAKLSIVATQMMGSMVDNPEPTRAEVNDVSHAVMVGADCVMLSDETANGKYPIEAVETMKRVINYSENNADIHILASPRRSGQASEEVCAAAVSLARRLSAQAIVAETKTGQTAYQVAAERPACPIISVTSNVRVAQQLALVYANKSFLRPDSDTAGLDLAKALVESGYLSQPSTVVITSGHQPGLAGATNTIRVHTL
jgi:pyruvate kinase